MVRQSKIKCCSIIKYYQKDLEVIADSYKWLYFCTKKDKEEKKEKTKKKNISCQYSQKKEVLCIEKN